MKTDSIISIAILGALAIGGYALVKKLGNTEFSGFDFGFNNPLSNNRQEDLLNDYTRTAGDISLAPALQDSPNIRSLTTEEALLLADKFGDLPLWTPTVQVTQKNNKPSVPANVGQRASSSPRSLKKPDKDPFKGLVVGKSGMLVRA